MKTAILICIACYIYVGLSIWVGKCLKNLSDDYPEPGVKKW